MIPKKCILLIFLTSTLIANGQIKKVPYTNSLIEESSPYLLDHAHNPVNWYAWREKALQKAKKEDKPLIISIGYAACHWCHVMERETFSDTAIANFMNKHFVAIKVDREERPDIDKVYMDAIQLITGEGGWPLNAFALPDGRPFHAGTYFPREQWLQLLTMIHTVYEKDKQKITVQAENVASGIKSQEVILLNKIDSKFTQESYEKIYPALHPSIDYTMGGLRGTQKFPMPSTWEFSLQFYYLTGDTIAAKAALTTLDRMAFGGIYDQLAGGFSRYVTDDRWKVPHFEKMLYDNGQLVSVYAHAFQLTRNPLYASVITETLNFVKTNLTSPGGGFYSSLNADSEDEEGKYYTWSYKDVDRILDNQSISLLADYYQIFSTGNWEHGKNILHRKITDEEFRYKHHLTIQQFSNTLASAKKKLLKKRNARTPPSTDDKILTSWNALMIKGYIDAYRVFGNHDYLETALKAASFLEKRMLYDSNRLWRNFKNNKASIPAFLDDYSFLADAYIELYQVTFNIHWLELANSLTAFTIEHFYDKTSGLFFYSSDQSDTTIQRKIETIDGVIPSSNSVMAHNLFKLAHYFDKADYRTLSAAMVNTMTEKISTEPHHYANWARLYGLLSFTLHEIAILGDEALKKNKALQRYYLPNAIFMGGNKENMPLLQSKLVAGKTIIYVCQDKICKSPVTEVTQAIKLVKTSAKP